MICCKTFITVHTVFNTFQATPTPFIPTSIAFSGTWVHFESVLITGLFHLEGGDNFPTSILSILLSWPAFFYLHIKLTITGDPPLRQLQVKNTRTHREIYQAKTMSSPNLYGRLNYTLV